MWLAFGLAICVFSSTAFAEDEADAFEYWPGAQYDPAIPTYADVLGFAPGERITRPEDLLRYCDALVKAAPGRVTRRPMGHSWEGRDLAAYIVCSESNTRRLDDIASSIRRLADPRVLERGEADRLIAELPVMVWLTYGVHGDEISSPDAGLFTAYHLLASQGDPVVEKIFAAAIVFLVPSQNPDGRARFVSHYEQARGLRPDADVLAAEHNEPWPSGRFNHYLFDMNRDWFAQTQPEIRAQASALHGWFPQVVVDLHEMGSDATYYFAPAASPINPFLTEHHREGWEIVGRNNAGWFDQFGFDYFTREVYDAFYPGYGDSWPALHGAVAMTYEQASPSGLVIHRRDGTNLTYRDAVQRHFVASVSTAQAAATNRERLLRGFYEFRREAIEDGRNGSIRSYVLPYEGNTAAVRKLATMLASQGIEVRRSADTFRAAGEPFPPGSYVVDAAQPAGRLASNLLDAHVEMDAAFVTEQERRRRKNLPDEIYDVTAWSLPLLYGVRCVPVKESVRIEDVPLVSADRDKLIEGSIPPSAAYLVRWGTSDSAWLLGKSLDRGISVWSADKSFRQADRTYPRGSLIFKISELSEDAQRELSELAEARGVSVFGTDTSWVDEGVNFGSEHVVKMKQPRVALAWDEPTSPPSAGAARYVLEVEYGLPVTVVRTKDLVGPDLDRFDVVILPDGRGYDRALGADAKELGSWVERGGTLIAIGGAVEFLATKDVGLLAIQQENAAAVDGGDTKDAESKKPDEDSGRAPGRLIEEEEGFRKAIRPEDALPDPVAGVLLRAHTDPDHWITAGLPETVNVLVQGRAMFAPIRLDEGVNAVHFAGPDDLLASGFLWEENRKQYAYKPFVVVQPRERGFVIAFTADPNFRGYMVGLNPLFLNAVLRGPAHAGPMRGVAHAEYGRGQRD
jgi:hypothetical protein